jgi:hypothetical protein
MTPILRAAADFVHGRLQSRLFMQTEAAKVDGLRHHHERRTAA